MSKADLLPEAESSRGFRSKVDGIVAAAKRDATDQKTKFEDLARELECDEDEATFEGTVKKVAKSPPLPAEKPS